MAINLTQLYTTIKSQALKSVYLIASDTTLLQQEALDAIRKTAKNIGFNQRDLFYVESGFNWDDFFGATKNYNLFSEKTIIELNHPGAKFDEKTTKNLLDYLENPPSDKILLITTDKLTSAQQKTRWYKALDSKGIVVNIKSISKPELPQWITTRAQALKLHLSAEAIKLLTELTEGNLNATKQALYKSQLLYPDGKIGAAEIIKVISDSARFNVFDLGNLILAGQARDALRCLNGLKDTGTEATLVLWAICREIREVLNISHQHKQGIPLQQLLQHQWSSRQPLLKQTLSRLSFKTLNQLLGIAEEVDHAIKGISSNNPWDLLETLLLAFCGKKIASLNSQSCHN